MNANREPEAKPAETGKRPWRSRLYDRLPVSVDQVEKIIIVLTVLIVLLILIGIFT